MQLSICIPTFNRAYKLRRVTHLFIEQIVAANLQDKVCIIISDNSSTDATPQICHEMTHNEHGVRVDIYRQPRNLGIPGNLRALYDLASSDYIWFFSDDDLPKQHAVMTILESLETHQPTALLFSFEQPVGNRIATFSHSERVTIIRDPSICIRSLFHYVKLSIYVLRRIELTEESNAYVASIGDNEWYGFLTIPYSVMCDTPNPSVAIISTVLAQADDDSQANWGIQPLNWRREANLFHHPRLRRHNTECTRNPEDFMYRKAIDGLWSWRVGYFQVAAKVEAKWWAAIKDLPIRFGKTKRFRRALALLILKLWPSHGPRLILRLCELLCPHQPQNKLPRGSAMVEETLCGKAA
jgi:glycosyltransferase involved in cell wall biosynthesis